MAVTFSEFRLTDGVPIYLQIIRYLKAAVAAGAVHDGDEMPSRRVLSALLGVNPNTIQKAYKLLEDEGLIRSHAGAKSYVSATKEQVSALRRQLPEWCARDFVRQMKAMGLQKDEAAALVRELWEEEAEEG